MPDYRALIEQVEARGGPLKAYDTVSGPAVGHLTDSTYHPAAWLLADLGTIARAAICDVLRRDLGRQGYDVIQAHRVLNTDTTIHMVRVVGSESEPVGASAQTDLLAAHLRAWLEAVPEEATQGS